MIISENSRQKPRHRSGQTTGQKLGLAERRYRIHLEFKQHSALIKSWVTKSVGRLLTGVFGPDAIELGRYARTLNRIVLTDFSHGGRLDADPVIRISGIDEEETHLRIGSKPFDLFAFRGQVEKHGVALVVEPHGRQIRPAGAAHNRNNRSYRRIDDLLVDGVKIVEAGDRFAIAYRELTILRSRSHILKLRYFDSHRPLP